MDLSSTRLPISNVDRSSRSIVVCLEPPSPPVSKKVTEQKEKQKRQVTTLKNWDFTPSDLSFENQTQLIKQLYEKMPTSHKHCRVVERLLHNKIYGYRTQDLEKSLYSENEFIDNEFVYELLLQSDFLCYYCKRPVDVLYEYVREPTQWTLDRLDNKYGHNKNNVVIACLSCNLRRKTMYHERFVFTKQLAITKTG